MQARGKVLPAAMCVSQLPPSVPGAESRTHELLTLPPFNARAAKRLPRAQSRAAVGFAARRQTATVDGART